MTVQGIRRVFQDCFWEFGVTGKVVHARNLATGIEWLFTRHENYWERKRIRSSGFGYDVAVDAVGDDDLIAMLDSVYAEATK